MKYLIIFSLVLISCSKSVDRKLSSIITPESIGEEPQILGGNYNSKAHFFDPGIRCIQVDEDRDIEIIHNEKAAVATTSSIDYETLSKEVGQGFEIGSSLPLGDPLSLSFNYLKSSKESDTSIVFSFRTTVKTGNVLLKGPHKLTREAIQAAEASAEEFMNYCGDQFVFKLNKGAKAYVSVKIDVGSKETKRAIEGELGVTVVDFFELAANFKNLKKKFGLTGSIVISAYQEGGFAARINSIFGTGEGMARCNNASFAKCEVLLKEIVYYFAHGFSQQFDQYYRDLFGGGVVKLPPSSKTLSYSTQSYCKLPINDRPKVLKCGAVDNSANIKILDDEKKNVYDELDSISELKTSDLNLAPDYKKMLDLYQSQMVSNLGHIQNAKKECLRDKWACSSTVREVGKRFYRRNPGLMSALQKEERVEVCFISGSKVELSRLNIKLYEGSKVLKSIKIFDAPKYRNKECFIYHAPELSDGIIDSVRIQVMTLFDQESKFCRLRVEKKFKSWAEWDLKRIEITQLATNKKSIFKGKYIKARRRCLEEENAERKLSWVRLELLN